MGLGVYHGYLVCVNQTTYEQVKGIYTDGSNPFDRGVRGNCYDILFSKVRPRYFEPVSGRLLWPTMECSAVPMKSVEPGGEGEVQKLRPEKYGDAPLHTGGEPDETEDTGEGAADGRDEN